MKLDCRERSLPSELAEKFVQPKALPKHFPFDSGLILPSPQPLGRHDAKWKPLPLQQATMSCSLRYALIGSQAVGIWKLDNHIAKLVYSPWELTSLKGGSGNAHSVAFS